jgi:hypothetical protein
MRPLIPAVPGAGVAQAAPRVEITTVTAPLLKEAVPAAKVQEVRMAARVASAASLDIPGAQRLMSCWFGVLPATGASRGMLGKRGKAHLQPVMARPAAGVVAAVVAEPEQFSPAL